MKPEPSDREEETRARGIAEQCWLGPLCLLFWVILILGFIHGCVKGAEVTLAWDANDPAQRVEKYRVYLGLELLAEVTGTTARVILPDAPCEIAVVAINSEGTSPPAFLKLSYLTDQQSTDLKAWDTLRGYHREFLPGRRFYRTKIQTPP